MRICDNVILHRVAEVSLRLKSKKVDLGRGYLGLLHLITSLQGLVTSLRIVTAAANPPSGNRLRVGFMVYRRM